MAIRTTGCKAKNNDRLQWVFKVIGLCPRMDKYRLHLSWVISIISKGSKQMD
jgi:hypothetical protein